MMRKRLLVLLAALAVLAALVAPSVANAHNSHGWYWGTGRAESKLIGRYSDVLDASCRGFGARYHGLYKHFSCIAYTTTDEPNFTLTLHVTGRSGFVAMNTRAVPGTGPVPVTAPPTVGYPGTGYPVMCVDGTISYSGSHQGACSWHGGVA
jgi:hypothetical protein